MQVQCPAPCMLIKGAQATEPSLPLNFAMLSRRAARLSAQLAGRALAGEPALTCVRGAHGGRPDNYVHATTVLCVRKDGQASVGLDL